MLIIVSREHAGLYESLKPAQEARRGDRVILDRRVADRRRRLRAVPATGRSTVAKVAMRGMVERRTPVSGAERALMNVLGFMVLHRDGGAATSRRTRAAVRKPPRRAAVADPDRRPRTRRPLQQAAG